MRRFFSLITVIAVQVTACSGHEFWLEPASHYISDTDVLRIKLMHGERFSGSSVPRNDAMINRFEFVSVADTEQVSIPVLGRDQTNTNLLRCAYSGVMVYESDWYQSDLDAAAFEEYLAEEGLESIIAERAERGESDLPGVERYKRCSKSLISVEKSSLIDTWVELPLEIHISDAIDGSQLMDQVTVTVRFEGRPIEDHRVIAVRRQAPDRLIELRTDREGQVIFVPGHNDDWMVTCIHMTRSASEADADWDSYWASTTFHWSSEPKSDE
ncbi:MAG: DUF4198 domain-containing protein [Phycisphaerales bacterium]